MMLDYWPLIALGALCSGLLVVAWRVATRPLPRVRDPREDWKEWHEIAARNRKRRAGL